MSALPKDADAAPMISGNRGVVGRTVFPDIRARPLLDSSPVIWTLTLFATA